MQSREADDLNAASHVDDTINKPQTLTLIKIPESGEHDVVSGDDEDDDSVTDDALDAKIDSDGDADVEESKVAEDSLRNSKGNVTTLSKYWDIFENDGIYKAVIYKRNRSDAENFERFRGRFLQSLCDNLKQRFPSSDLLQALLESVIMAGGCNGAGSVWREACCKFT